jgi:hypothetical protein
MVGWPIAPVAEHVAAAVCRIPDREVNLEPGRADLRVGLIAWPNRIAKDIAYQITLRRRKGSHLVGNRQS